MTGFLIYFRQEKNSLFENWPAFTTLSLAYIASCPGRTFLVARARQEQKGLRNGVLAGKRGNAPRFFDPSARPAKKIWGRLTDPSPDTRRLQPYYMKFSRHVTSRFCDTRISRHLNFTLLRSSCTVNRFNFAIFST